MSKLTNCEHAVFDEVWGEHKCKKLCMVVYNPDRCESCKHYKKKSAKEKKER